MQVLLHDPRNVQYRTHSHSQGGNKMSQQEQIHHGDPEPAHDTRWMDAAGSVHDYSENEGRWGMPGMYHFTIWNRIPERYFPMTRIEDKR